MFPLFLIFVAGLLAVLIGCCVLYIRFYKRRINEALNGTLKKQKAMPAPFTVAIMLLIAFLIFAVFMSFVIGFGSGYRSLDGKEDGQIDVNAFYAEIISIDESEITVNGISMNEKDYRGEFTFYLHESVIVEWNSQQIRPDELREGDMVAIILLRDVAGVEDLFKIQVLKD